MLTHGSQIDSLVRHGGDHGDIVVTLQVEFAVRDWYSPTEAGIGDTYPFVDNRNAVGVIFSRMWSKEDVSV